MSDTAANFIVFALVAVGVSAACLLAWLPGYIARERGHQNAQAIALCGWLSLLLWPLWFVAIIWANTGPDHSEWIKQQRGRLHPAGRPKPPPGWTPAKSLNYDESKL